MADRYPPEKYDVKPLPDPAIHGDHTFPDGRERPGSGRFDQIYAVTDKTSGETRYVVVEAKGPNAELGTRKGLDGRTNYQQGHPQYVESVIFTMKINGTPAEKQLAQELEDAQMAGLLDYSVVKAKVGEAPVIDPVTKEPKLDNDGNPVKQPVYGGYTMKHFDLSI